MNFSFYSQNMVSLTIVHHLLWVDSAFRRKHYMCEVKYNGFCGYLLILWMCSNDINRCKVYEQHKMWLLYLFYLIRNWIKYSVLVFISVVLPATHTECVSINSVPIVCVCGMWKWMWNRITKVFKRTKHTHTRIISVEGASWCWKANTNHMPLNKI